MHLCPPVPQEAGTWLALRYPLVPATVPICDVWPKVLCGAKWPLCSRHAQQTSCAQLRHPCELAKLSILVELSISAILAILVE